MLLKFNSLQVNETIIIDNKGNTPTKENVPLDPFSMLSNKKAPLRCTVTFANCKFLVICEILYELNWHVCPFILLTRLRGMSFRLFLHQNQLIDRQRNKNN